MVRSRFVPFLLIVCVICSMMLAACGDSTSTSSSPVTTAAGTANPAVTTGTATTAAASGEQVNLVFSNWTSTGPVADLYTQELKNFQAAHPNIKVEEVHIPFAEYPQKVQTMMAGKNAPDVMYMSQLWMQAFAEKGALLDLQSFIDKNPGFNYADFNSVIQDTGKFNGKLYEVFDNLDFIALFYNKDMFKAANLELPNENWTWDDLVKAGKAMTKDTNGDGKMDQYGMLAPSGYVSFSWLDQNGGGVLNKDKNASMFNDPKSVEAVSWINNLINTEKISPPPSVTKQEGTSAMFIAGKVGMAAYGPWLPATLNAGKKFEWGLALLPKGKVNRNSFISGSGYTLSKDTKHPQEAFELMSWFLTPEFMTKLLKLGGNFPSRKSLYTLPEFSTPENKVFVEQSKYLTPLPVSPKWNEMYDVINKGYELIFSGSTSPAEGAKSIDTQINQIFK